MRTGTLPRLLVLWPGRLRRGLAPWIKILAGTLALLGIGSGGWFYCSFDVRDVTPAPDGYVNRKHLTVSARYQGHPGEATLMVDGRPVPLVDLPDRHELQAQGVTLGNGAHRFQLSVQRRLGLGTVEYQWSATVDTVPPRITLKTPAPGAILRETKTRLEGRTKPGARLFVTVAPKPEGGNGRMKLTADARGAFSSDVMLPPDHSQIRIEAVDRAGNHARLGRKVLCDLVPPGIGSVSPEADAVIKSSPDVMLKADVVKEGGSSIKRVTLTIDDRPPVSIALGDRGGQLQYKASDLPEGTREIRLEVEDQAGWVATKSWSFLVDTTETFGLRPMTRGAVGKDVTFMQKRLVKWGAMKAEEISGTYDDNTSRALQSFQASRHIDSDGIAGLKTIEALSPQIYVDLGHFSLILFDGGKKVKSYTIAHGMPQYPTPPGSFRIAYLERNPTWIPPKGSLWAKEAKVTPPGPGNPLGTRWIGLNSSDVGIHGTPAAWTVGSRASHGCIRMRIPDVEDLFERVNPGAAVTISWEAPTAKGTPRTSSKKPAGKKISQRASGSSTNLPNR